MAKKIYITTSGNEKVWLERPDGTFQSSKSRLILSHTDVQKSISSGHLKEVLEGETMSKTTKKPIYQSQNLFDEI